MYVILADPPAFAREIKLKQSFPPRVAYNPILTISFDSPYNPAFDTIRLE